MKTTISIALVLALGLASGSYAAEGIWTTKADMPTARMCLSTSSVNGKIYAIGGSPGYNQWYQGLTTVEEYDPATDTWTKKADMPTARTYISTCAVNGKIYAIGGLPSGTNHLSQVDEYDPATDTWTTVADMPTARSGVATSAVNGKIYAIGGWLGWSTVLSTVEEYDPVTDTWKRKADMPTRRYIPSSSVVDGKIYVVGGTSGSTCLSTVEAYDPVTDTWTRKANMPMIPAGPGSSVVNGRIYVMGGVPSLWAVPYSRVEEYSPTTDTWTAKADMPTPRGWLSSSAVNGKIYAIGGASRYESTPLSAVEEYDPYPLVVDFNGDEKVNFGDLCMLAQYWYRDDSPFVNRRMDYEYLARFAEYWLEDYRLIAHWKLDETEGIIAHDSVGSNDAAIAGAIWQPDGGMVDGALEFDGTYDLVTTPFVLNPADGAFSVFTWVNGGAPGQVIISQTNGTGTGQTWLGADISNGELMTTLTDGSASTEPLVSEFSITDDQWHHIGFVWNGSHRHLYVDGVEIAKDTDSLDSLQSTDGGLLFGIGKDYAATSCFSGLIDDVRIYNVALSVEEIEELAR